MVLRPGFHFPLVDLLGELEVLAIDGACIVTPPSGGPDPTTGRYYAYIVLPDSGTTFRLYRVDLESRAIVRLEDPPAAAGGAYDTANMTACYDELGLATLDTPGIYVTLPLTQAPWMQHMFFDTTAAPGAAWNIEANIAGLAAPLCNLVDGLHLITTNLGAVGVFVEPATAVDFADYLWLGGDGGVFVGGVISGICRYQKSADAWVVLAGGGGARAAAPGIGTRLLWVPTYNPNLIVSPRGDGTANIDTYGCALDNWNALAAPTPAPVWEEGSDLISTMMAPGTAAVRAGASDQDRGQILRWNLLGNRMENLAALADGDGPQHQGQALAGYWIGGVYYLAALVHASHELQRIRLVI